MGWRAANAHRSGDGANCARRDQQPAVGASLFASGGVCDTCAVCRAHVVGTGAISPAVDGIGATIASLTSLAFSVSFVIRTRDRPLFVRLARAMLCVAIASAVGIAFGGYLQPLAERWIAIARSLR
jgi:hypothetical protein